MAWRVISLANDERVSEMAKAFSISGMAVAALVLLLFGLDAAMKMPFERISLAADIGLILSACVLGYLSFNAFRGIR